MVKKVRLGGNSRRLKPLVSLAIESGYQVSITNGGHLKMCPPISGFPPLFFAKTPSDFRAPKNAIAFLVKQIRAIQAFKEIENEDSQSRDLGQELDTTSST
jgi:hypothetical protein